MTRHKISLNEMLASLRAAGEETRLRLLVLLSQGEQSVKDITAILEQSQPRISRHLKLLTQSGLVERYQEGSWVYYRLSDRRQMTQMITAMVCALDIDEGLLKEDKKRAEKVLAKHQLKAQLYFKNNAAQWDKIRGFHVTEAALEQAMLDMAEQKKRDVLVDFGTGTGRMLELFAGRFHQAIGFDISSDMLLLASEKLEKAGLKQVQLRHGDLFDVPLEDESADCIIIHQVLHFLDEPGRVIREAARVLKDGGEVLVVDFAPHNIDFLREEQAHRRLGFAQRQIADWMAEAGLAMNQHTVLKPDQAGRKEKLTVSIWQGFKQVSY